MDYIPSFIARKNGKEAITYPIPCMEKYLKDTYGVTVYQEQVMLLSRQLADFTRGESDALRKAMGKKKIDIVNAMKPKFIEGGKKNGHDPKILEKIWTDWEKFASYAFNKSHAACYSWVAYQTAYMKANYPAEFMAAIMTRRRDQITEITKLMDECKQMGIATLGPDVNESYLKFGVNHKGEIRFGLAAIKGMGDSVAEAIIKERDENGPFTSIFNFAERVSFNVNRKAYESLALSGGFDSFGIRREVFFAEDSKGVSFLDTLVRYGQNYAQAKAEAQNSLFGGFDSIEIATPAIPKTDERWSDIERLNKERDLVGIYLSAHPLDEYKIVLDNLCNARCSELADRCAALYDREDITLGGIVTGIQSRFGKNNKPWGIITLEDFEGSGELVLFGDDWLNLNGKFIEGAAVYITGKMASRFQNSNQKELKIGNVELLQSIKEKSIDRITISLNTDELNDQVVAELNELICEHPGKTKLFFQLRDSMGKNHVLLRSQKHSVDVRHTLIDYIERTEALDYKIN
jgi:DNA polymerase-3 subunit alpha